jgi:hypothetical protein
MDEKEYRIIRYEIYKVEYSVRAYDKDHAAEKVAEGDGTLQKEEFHDLYLGLPTNAEERV